MQRCDSSCLDAATFLKSAKCKLDLWILLLLLKEGDNDSAHDL
jgi:hypothetical protein